MDFVSWDGCGEDCADGSFHLTDTRLYIGYIILLVPEKAVKTTKI